MMSGQGKKYHTQHLPVSFLGATFSRSLRPMKLSMTPEWSCRRKGLRSQLHPGDATSTSDHRLSKIHAQHLLSACTTAGINHLISLAQGPSCTPSPPLLITAFLISMHSIYHWYV
ncbi:hypothetical protein EI94DRAFT_76733 [Lactarius quietus]|nr:hypothetical protein EI94DRAFT_76733 [Lactarius quietus]